MNTSSKAPEIHQRIAIVLIEPGVVALDDGNIPRAPGLSPFRRRLGWVPGMDAREGCQGGLSPTEPEDMGKDP